MGALKKATFVTKKNTQKIKKQVNFIWNFKYCMINLKSNGCDRTA